MMMYLYVCLISVDSWLNFGAIEFSVNCHSFELRCQK